MNKSWRSAWCKKAEISDRADSDYNQGGSLMETMYYIGLDVHKKTISYCVKDGSGRIYAEGSIPATRLALDMWMKALPRPWTVAMGSDHLHGLDLRLSQAACRSSEGGASADATSDCGG
jgi:hypothetical protein